MRILLIYILILVSLAFVSCSDNSLADSPSAVDDRQLEMVGSRADVEDDNYLDGSFESFVVWGYLVNQRNTPEPVFYNYRVDKQPDEEWQYHDITYNGEHQTIHFWNSLARSYRFDAIAPVEKLGDIQEYNTTENVLTLRGITANQKGSVDWLMSSHIRHISDASNLTLKDEDLIVNETANPKEYKALTYYFERVDMKFHHILSLIEFRVFCEDGSAAVVSGLKSDFAKAVYTKGDYKTSSPHWTYASSETATSLFDATGMDVSVAAWDPDTVDDPREIATSLAMRLEIPQTLDSDQRTLSVSIVAGDTEYKGEVQLPEALIAEDHYIYYFKIPADKSQEEIILFDMVIDKFEDGGKYAADSPIINW